VDGGTAQRSTSPRTAGPTNHFSWYAFAIAPGSPTSDVELYRRRSLLGGGGTVTNSCRTAKSRTLTIERLLTIVRTFMLLAPADVVAVFHGRKNPLALLPVDTKTSVFVRGRLDDFRCVRYGVFPDCKSNVTKTKHNLKLKRTYCLSARSLYPTDWNSS